MSRRKTDDRYCYKLQATFSESQWFAIANAAAEDKTPITAVIRNAVTLYLRMREANEDAEQKH